MKLKLPLFLFILLIISGCKQSNDSPSSKIYLLSQVAHTGTATDITTFKYDDQNHLIEYMNDAGKTDFKFTYDANDRIILRDEYYGNTGLNEKISFDYSTPNTVKSAITGNPSIPANATPSIYTLNDKNQAVKVLLGNGNGAYTLFTYDDRGNKLTETTYLNVTTTTGPSTNVIYTYDQNKSYLSNVKGNLFFIFSITFINNFTSVTANDLIHVNGVSHFTNSTFEYNSDGYPIKETRLSTSSVNSTPVSDVYTYTYITK